ncbi:MAG TPA: hypothetical protein DCM05_03630 [Elusimicrobia bacterium]|nr:hypothetical protein [Elusimicrobiota bacterium]
MILKAWRKGFATLLSAALLSQQGLFISEACAQTVSGQQAGAQSGSNVGAAGAAVVPTVQLGNIAVNPAMPLAGTNALPTLTNVQPAAPQVINSPKAAAVLAPSAIPAAQVSKPAALKATPLSAPKAAPKSSEKTFVPPVGPSGAVANAPDAENPFSGASPDLSQGQQTAERFKLKTPEQAAQAFDSNESDEPDIGWDQVPPVPSEAPDSIKDPKASLDIAPGAKFTASPKNWASEIIYSVILDRFGRSKDHQTWGDQKLPTTRHGGNIRGLIDRLDYLQGMGVTTLLINPLYMSPPAAYHNYWPIHFMAVDPNLGTMADFQELVKKAHGRGMRIVLDVVFNHTGPILEYEGGWKWSQNPKEIKRWRYPVGPVELRSKEHYHRRGSIDNWNDPDQMRNGDFPGGLNQLATERKETQDVLLHISKWWMKQTDVDGFRLDTYPHVAPDFWNRFFQETRDYAKKLGKDNFLVMGEIYNGDPRALAPEVGNGRLDAAYNYPAHFWDNDALHGRAPTSVLEASLNGIRAVMGHALNRLVRFLDNHDKPRFLGQHDPIGIARVALAYTLFSIGIPYVYYGTEQAFRQFSKNDYGMDAYREDMFPEGKFRNPATQGDDFNAQNPMYKHLAALAEVRKTHPALSLGEQYVRWSDPNGPGLYAFSRIHDGEEVLVVMNTAGEARSAQMWVDGKLTPGGAELVDALGSGYAAKAAAQEGGGSKVGVQIPGHGVLVLVRKK